jgi:hypothetical protein
MKNIWLLHLLLLLALPTMARAQFTYTTDNGTITITGYTGPGGVVTIPSTIVGLPVTRIGPNAFQFNDALTSISMPQTLASIADSAFNNCGGLTNVTFTANASVTNIADYAFHQCLHLANCIIPSNLTYLGISAFDSCALTSVAIPDHLTSIQTGTFAGCSSLTNVTIGRGVTNIGFQVFTYCYGLTSVTIPDNVVTIREVAFGTCTGLTNVTIGHGVTYLPGTLGWGPTFCGRPTAPWMLSYPLILDSGPSFGVQTNQFGFIISWAYNPSVVVEACTNLAYPIWSPVSTNVLTDGWSYFSDPQWRNYRSRYYRARSL